MAKSAVGLTAAALLTMAAITFTSARTAEQKSGAPLPAAAPVALAPVGPTFDADPNDPQWLTALKKKLQTKVTMEFENAELESSFSMIRQLSATMLIVLPDAAAHAPPFTIKVKDESMASALQRAIAQEKLHYDFVAGGLVIGDADDLKIIKAAKLELSPELAAKLQRSVTFEFVDQSLGDGAEFLSSLAKFKAQFEKGADKRPVSFRATNIPLREALLWMLILTGTEATEKDGGLVIGPAAKTIKIPEPQQVQPAAVPQVNNATPQPPPPAKPKDEF